MFSKELHEATQSIWQQSKDHPFIQELVAGSLPEEIFRYYLLQDCYYLIQFGKAHLLLAEKADDPVFKARETSKGIDTETFLEIHAQHYAERFHVDVKNTYAMLSDAVTTLFNRQVTYMTIDEKRNKPEKRVVRWVSGISYVEGAGIVKLRFAPEIVPLITRLEQNFTSYELMQVANLNLYATRLYELLVSWRSTGKTPIIEINDFRSKLPSLHDFADVWFGR